MIVRTIPDFYIEFVKKTIAYPRKNAKDYVRMGIFGELGEIASVIKKALFNSDELATISDKLVDEIGDLVWYLTAYSIESYCSTMVEFREVEEVPFSGIADFQELFEAIFVFSTNLVEYGNSSIAQYNISFIFELVIKLLRTLNCTLDECVEKNMGKINERAEQKVKQFAEKYE